VTAADSVAHPGAVELVAQQQIGDFLG
jgi:hypothetical protein